MKDLRKAISLVKGSVDKGIATSSIKWSGNTGESYFDRYKIKKALFSVERHCGRWVWKFKVYHKNKGAPCCSKHAKIRWKRIYKNYYVCKCEHCGYLYVYDHLTF